MDLEKSVWSQEIRQSLEGLTEGEHWNYDALKTLLERMEEEASASVKQLRSEYEKADSAVEKLAKKLAAEEELRRKQKEFARVSEEKTVLEEQREAYILKEQQLEKAGNAGFVESAMQLREQLETQLKEKEIKIASLWKERGKLGNEAEELKGLT